MKSVLAIVLVVALSLITFPAPAHAQDFCDMENGLIAGLLGQGINCLDDSGWRSYPIGGAGLPFSSVDGMTICPDGTLWVVDILGIYSFNGSNWQEGEGGDWFTPNAMACDADGLLWVAHGDGVSHFDGTAWVDYAIDQFGSGSFIIGVDDIEIGADGSIWALTGGSVAQFTGDTWQVFEEGSGFSDSYFFNALVIDSQGQTWVAHSNGLLSYDGSSWTQHNSDLISLETLAIDSQDRLWVGTLTEGAAMYDGSSWEVFNRENSSLTSNNVRAIAVDAQDRVWFGTAWGLSVYDGTDWTTFLMSNSDVLDNDVWSLVVTGNGPALPDLTEKQPGSVTGIIENGTEVVAGTQVELCTEAVGGVYFGPTPCDGQPGHMIVTTGDDGAFTFSEVLVGRYELAVETPDGWISFIGIGAEFEVLEGETTDLADIDISG
ncbi:MAG: hypothetical protein L0154_08410 [Chloroflexi bacterium]|nr:hypothetical protein [Chloroflexota bacterium]